MCRHYLYLSVTKNYSGCFGAVPMPDHGSNTCKTRRPTCTLCTIMYFKIDLSVNNTWCEDGRKYGCVAHMSLWLLIGIAFVQLLYMHSVYEINAFLNIEVYVLKIIWNKIHICYKNSSWSNKGANSVIEQYRTAV